MEKRNLQRSMYELRDTSLTSRIVMAVAVGVWVAVSWWLLFGAGLEIAGHWAGRSWINGDTVRRICLAAGFSIYYIRVLFTVFVFFKRGVSWAEGLGVGFFILCIYLLLGIAGGTNAATFGVTGYLGVFLFVAGSWMNSYAEYRRHIWKQNPQNQGCLYTEGLFRYSRHPNYLGDLISFSGLCLISGAWVTAVIPVIMLAGFVFVNIPMLDAHLRDHYGAAFDDYARRTRKLIPLVY